MIKLPGSYRKKSRNWAFVYSGCLLLVSILSACANPGITSELEAETIGSPGNFIINFENLQVGQIVSDVGIGRGIDGVGADNADSVKVFARRYNSRRELLQENHAMIFDSECKGARSRCTGSDPDLFQPGQGNILIIGEELSGEDPDDNHWGGNIEFGFDEFAEGRVDTRSVKIFDTILKGGSIELFRSGQSIAQFPIPVTGEGGNATITLNTSDVDLIRVTFKESGAVDDLLFSADSDNPIQDEVTKTITPDGGQIDLQGVGSVLFNPSALTSETSVTFSSSTSADTSSVFSAFAQFLGAFNPYSYDVKINTGDLQPQTASGLIEVNLNVPDEIADNVPEGFQPRVFAYTYYDIAESEEITSITILDSYYDANKRVVAASIPSYAFSERFSGDGTLEAVLTISSTPGVDVIDVTNAASNTDLNPLALPVPTPKPDVPGGCQAASIICPTGNCRQTSAFDLNRPHPVKKDKDGNPIIRPHEGIDLGAVTPGVSGDSVVAAADGTIESIEIEGYDGTVYNSTAGFDQANFDAAKKNLEGSTSGYGLHIKLRHADGSGSLYAHLDPSTLDDTTLIESLKNKGAVKQGGKIANMGNTGVGTATHLHFGLIPNGALFKKGSYVDPAQCIDNEIANASIFVADNGTINDDSFSIAIDGKPLGTTPIGGSDGFNIGALRKGDHSLVLTAVVAPDDAGTYELILREGITFAGGGVRTTGVLAQGASSNFAIVAP